MHDLKIGIGAVGRPQYNPPSNSAAPRQLEKPPQLSSKPSSYMQRMTHRVEALVRVARLRPCEADRRLRLCGVYSIKPCKMLPQESREDIYAVWLLPSSAPVTIAHRRLTSRTQIRHILQPGDMLMRSAECRQRWTIAIAPLRSQDVPLGDVKRTRRLAFFASESDSLGGRGTHQPLQFVEARTATFASPQPSSRVGVEES